MLLYDGVLAARCASAAGKSRLTNKRRPSITRKRYSNKYRYKCDSKGRSAAVARPDNPGTVAAGGRDCPKSSTASTNKCPHHPNTVSAGGRPPQQFPSCQEQKQELSSS